MNASASARAASIAGLLQQGDLGAAANAAAAARTMFPLDAEFARLHGVALLMLGRAVDARAALEAAVRLHPDGIEAQSNLASAMLASGDTDAAVKLLRQAVNEAPHQAALRNNLANALRAAGEDERAREQYLAALTIAPEHPGAGLNLAAVELALGRLDDAEQRLRGLLTRPAQPQAWLLFGKLLHLRRHYAEAQQAFVNGARLAPAAAEFPYQAGLMADELHQFADAIYFYRHALQLDPKLQLAEGQLLFATRRLYDWQDVERLGARIRARVAAGDASIDPFAFLAEATSPAEQLACARARAGHVMATRPVRAATPRPTTAKLVELPKVGFVSSGFGARGGVPHATALLTVALFEELGRRDDLELHLIATSGDPGSPIRERLRAAAHRFLAADGMPVPDLAERLRHDEFDVLVDIDGWCAGGLPDLFALRPAPLQVNWLGYPGSSGAPWIDYLVADRFLIQGAAQAFYSEAIACLPRCYQPSDPTRVVAPPPPRAAVGLPATAVVYASFNNAWKLNAASFQRMSAVLREVPDSVLWLLANQPEADARLRAAARAHGLDPARLIFAPALPHLEHLARLQLADLMLDTHPYNAHTTASDAMWAGCPVLTCPGETFAARVAGSLNHHLGMPELNAADDAQFIATAVRLGRDHAALAATRARLAQRRADSGLFDMHACAQDFSALLRAMILRQRNHLPVQALPFDEATRDAR